VHICTTKDGKVTPLPPLLFNSVAFAGAESKG
jgi:hypothetical protein